MRTIRRAGWMGGRMVPLMVLLLLTAGRDPAAAPAHDAVAGALDGEAAERIPENLILMDPGDRGTAYAVVVEKRPQRLHLYGYDGTFRRIFSSDCSTGKKSGAKRLSGDSKTPEGIYFFIDEHDDNELSPIYGIKAFPTDYPNLLDRIAGFTGNAIWLHGTNKPLAPRDSNGCIVLDNADIARTIDYITLHRTPIIIVEELSYASPEHQEMLREAVSDLLSDWNRAVQGGTYHDYLRHYDPGYLPDISWWPKWYAGNRDGEKGREPLEVILEGTSVYRHGDIFVALFDQRISAGDRAVPVGRRKLYLSHENDTFTIIGDEYQMLADPVDGGTDGPPLLAALSVLRGPDREEPAVADLSEDREEIAVMVDAWLSAWSEKDIEAYGEFYATDFRSRGKGKEAWIAYKDRLNRIYDRIDVKRRKDLTLEPAGEQRRTVSFVQEYESSGHHTVGIKELILKQEDGRWKIYRETWRRM